MSTSATEYGLTIAASSKQVSVTTALSAASVLTKKTSQLRSLLMLLSYEDASSALREMADELQSEVMWLVADLACEVDLLAKVATGGKEARQ